MTKYPCRVTDGKITLLTDDPIKDGDYNLTRQSNSNIQRQRSYLFGVVYKLISNEIGESVNDVHEMMKFEFLRDHLSVDTVRGRYDLIKMKSLSDHSADMDTVTMTDYIEQVRKFGAEFLGLNIPDPS